MGVVGYKPTEQGSTQECTFEQYAVYSIVFNTQSRSNYLSQAHLTDGAQRPGGAEQGGGDKIAIPS